MNVTTEQLFNHARTQNGYLPTPVPDEQLHQLYEMLKWGPTSANSSPARFLFVRSAEEKQKLANCMSPNNQHKVLEAPVTAIIGMDLEFHEHLPKLFPHVNAKAWFEGKPDFIHSTAFRNSSLQGAYLIIAARALGLGTGPMSGFDHHKVDEHFWHGTHVRTNFVCTLGHGDPAKLFHRNPRFHFDEVCKIV